MRMKKRRPTVREEMVNFVVTRLVRHLELPEALEPRVDEWYREEVEELRGIIADAVREALREELGKMSDEKLEKIYCRVLGVLEVVK